LEFCDGYSEILDESHKVLLCAALSNTQQQTQFT